MLSIQNINKTIKDKNIVDNISFEVPSGCICGLLGPNGAGKTTTFYIIAGLIKADKGDIFWRMKMFQALLCIEDQKLELSICRKSLLFFRIFQFMKTY